MAKFIFESTSSRPHDFFEASQAEPSKGKNVTSERLAKSHPD